MQKAETEKQKWNWTDTPEQTTANKAKEIAQKTTIDVSTKVLTHGWIYTLLMLIAIISLVTGIVIFGRTILERKPTDIYAIFNPCGPFFIVSIVATAFTVLVGKLEEIIFYLKRADERAAQPEIMTAVIKDLIEHK